MPVLRSQTVYLSITVTLASCRLLCHSNVRRSCSLVCLALSQHHAALALSCALLCLSITLLLLSHVPCFVSASRCSCSLMCLASSQHHAAQPEHHAALILMCLALSQYCFLMCFVSASLTPFLLSLMCLICLVTVLVHVHCFVSTSRRSYILRCLRYHAALALSCALLCSAQHHAAHVPCLVSA